MKNAKRFRKIARITLVVLIIFSGTYLYLSKKSHVPEHTQKLGVTFSQEFAEQMELDWKKLYVAMLDDLGVKYVRLESYWDAIEPERDRYNFEDLDWQVSEAATRGVKIVMTVGRRQPRWPECHDPEWVVNLSPEETRAKVLQNIKLVVNRYKDSPAVEIWQIENEPFLDFFGECADKITKAQLQEEIDLVRSLDNRRIMITDSGELSTWNPAIKMGDIFGSTLYLRTWSKYFGYQHYWFIPPSWYRVRAFVYGRPLDTTFIAELQAEPWFPDDPLTAPLEEHYHTMTPEILLDNVEFARETNFDRAYLWGVEWWYWIKETHGDDRFWNIAREKFGS